MSGALQGRRANSKYFLIFEIGADVFIQCTEHCKAEPIQTVSLILTSQFAAWIRWSLCADVDNVKLSRYPVPCSVTSTISLNCVGELNCALCRAKKI